MQQKKKNPLVCCMFNVVINRQVTYNRLVELVKKPTTQKKTHHLGK